MTKPSSNEWKKYNDDKRAAIAIPTEVDLKEMDALHKLLYSNEIKKHQLEIQLNSINESGEKLRKSIEALIDPDNIPDHIFIYYVTPSIRPKWKDEFIKVTSEAKAEEVAKKYKSPIRTKKIGIKFIDPEPSNIPIAPNQTKAKKRVQLKSG